MYVIQRSTLTNDFGDPGGWIPACVRRSAKGAATALALLSGPRGSFPHARYRTIHVRDWEGVEVHPERPVPAPSPFVWDGKERGGAHA